MAALHRVGLGCGMSADMLSPSGWWSRLWCVAWARVGVSAGVLWRGSGGVCGWILAAHLGQPAHSYTGWSGGIRGVKRGYIGRKHPPILGGMHTHIHPPISGGAARILHPIAASIWGHCQGHICPWLAPILVTLLGCIALAICRAVAVASKAAARYGCAAPLGAFVCALCAPFYPPYATA